MEEQERLAKRVSLVCDWLSNRPTDPSKQSQTACLWEDEMVPPALPALPLVRPAGKAESLPIDFVAGCDVTFLDVWKTPTVGIACIKVLSFADMTEVAEAIAEEEITFPYIPGLLAYRELPALISAYKKLDSKYRRHAKPRTVYIVDGQGIAHFRRLGIASHFGVLTGEITIGCAKSRLCGSFEIPIEPRLPSSSQKATTGETAMESLLTDEKTGTRLGTVLRVKPFAGRQRQPQTAPVVTREFTVKPEKYTNLLFISPGHRIDFDTATMVVRACLTKHIQPEPTRLAHNRLQDLRRKLL